MKLPSCTVVTDSEYRPEENRFVMRVKLKWYAGLVMLLRFAWKHRKSWAWYYRPVVFGRAIWYGVKSIFKRSTTDK